MKELISVIVPIFNMESYLNRCIRSIIEQTYDNLEIILVYDGSTDRSLAICEQWAEVDDRVLVIHKKNNGLSEASLEQLKNKTGEELVDEDMKRQGI